MTGAWDWVGRCYPVIQVVKVKTRLEDLRKRLSQLQWPLGAFNSKAAVMPDPAHLRDALKRLPMTNPLPATRVRILGFGGRHDLRA